MESRIILITGANSGIGLATSKILACASDTFHVIMTGRTYDKVEAARLAIESAGVKGTLTALELDVTDEESIETARNYVEKHFGKLDALINNAGTGSRSFDVGTRFRLCFNVNVTGPAMVSAALRPLLLKSLNPYSIYISSGARSIVRNAALQPQAPEGISNMDAYAASKAALNMIMVLEEASFRSKGLKVFAMSPGFVRSSLRGNSEEEISGWGKAGDPDDSGKLVLSILNGERDADVGCLVHKDGTYPW